MDLDRVKAFVWTVEEGSIVRAARKLHRSQPAVSRLLQQLEHQVGGALVDRSVRPLAPTERGLAVLSAARLMLRASDDMLNSASGGTGTAPVLRVGVSRSLVSALAEPEFRENPQLRGIQLRIRSGWSPRLCMAVAQRELDCAVVLMPLDWRPAPPCRASQLGRERLVIIGPADSDVINPLNGPWILNPDGCGFRAALTEALRRKGIALDVRIEVDAAPWEHIQLVASGLGVSVVPERCVKPELNVRAIKVPRVHLVTGVWLVASEGQALDGVCAVIGRTLAHGPSRPGAQGRKRRSRRVGPFTSAGNSNAR